MDLNNLREHFELLDDQDERYRYLIDLGKRLPPMPPELKTDHTKVDGCLSQVWLYARAEGEGAGQAMRFLADSDAILVRGLIAILMIAYEGHHPADIASKDLRNLFDELGFATPVSMNRRNGFSAMVQRIQAEAKSALNLASRGESA